MQRVCVLLFQGTTACPTIQEGFCSYINSDREEGGDDGRLAVYLYAYNYCHGCNQVQG